MCPSCRAGSHWLADCPSLPLSTKIYLITKKSSSSAIKPCADSISAQVQSSSQVVQDKLNQIILSQENMKSDINELKCAVSSFSERLVDLKSSVMDVSHRVRNLHDAQSQRYTWLKAAIQQPHLDDVLSSILESKRDFSAVRDKIDAISEQLSVKDVADHDCLSAEISSLHDSVSEILMQPTATSSSIDEMRRLLSDHNVLIRSSLTQVISNTSNIFDILRSAKDHALRSNVEIDVEDVSVSDGSVSDSASFQANSTHYRANCQGVGTHVHAREPTDWSEVVVIDDDLRPSHVVRDWFTSGGVQCSDIHRKPNSRYVHALVHSSSVDRLLADGLLTEHDRLVVEIPRGCRFETQK